MYGEDIIAAVKQAMEISEPELPTYPRKKAPILSPKVPKRVKVLKNWRDEISTSLGIDPALICNKSLLSAIAIRNPRNKEELDTIEDMKQWQKIAFGRDILAALKGVK
jgi:ribonuclease D